VSFFSFVLLFIIDTDANTISTANRHMMRKDSVTVIAPISNFLGRVGIINFRVRKTVAIEDRPNSNAVLILTKPFL
jgi:hypothetical protein